MPDFPNRQQMADYLEREGKRYGIAFRLPNRLANSHRALQASEYAREQRAFEPFHRALFYRYFTAGDDIGSIEVLRSVANDAGLDPGAMEDYIKRGGGEERLQEASQLGRLFGVDSSPTFIIDHRYKLVGAQPYNIFQKAFQQLLSE